jgi:nucleotidyltransferase substrate binding protein (TIGR01987 family)
MAGGRDVTVPPGNTGRRIAPHRLVPSPLPSPGRAYTPIVLPRWRGPALPEPRTREAHCRRETFAGHRARGPGPAAPGRDTCELAAPSAVIRCGTPRTEQGHRSSNQRQRTMKLDTTSLGNAVRRLREGLARHESDPMDEQIRDGLIQRFGFTYELSHKMLRRYLKETVASPDEVGHMPFADLIRTESAQGLLLSGWPAWRQFREMRTRTSHNYDAKVVAQVASAIPAFVEEAEHLYAELQRRRA